ncbi:MAG: RNA pseudouridine synthase [Ponticaulis sp.]|nr:RNA pseudouridine synthase [Ponticaulis sp.]|tara:strand:+ start:5314 stop:6024 length:711 start_codon:yes stop_codon:yes gene_type:complete
MKNREIVWLPDEDKDFVRSLLIDEDDEMLAFNKPAGLACQTRNSKDRTLDKLLWAFAKSNGKRPRLVHRIDADTTGVVIAAKTQPSAAALSKAFEDRQIKKTYLAFTEGDATKVTRCDSPIGTVRTSEGATISGIGGQAGVKDTKEALTRFNCVWTDGHRSLVECRPETGRMHQIRVHLAHLGHPILGDGIYGDAGNAPRLMLHALRLQGPHPWGSQFDYSAPVPDDFERLSVDLT